MQRHVHQNEDSPHALIDNYGRKISYLRLSITDRCNFNCFYCRPCNKIENSWLGDILTYEEIYRLIRIAVRLGIKKVRITGGEPLLRKGLMDFIPAIANIPGLEDLSLTTNGVLLKEKLKQIFDGGIRRLNISMDTLHRDRFYKITGNDRFTEIWEAISLAEEMNFSPIKINMVVMNGVNDDEITQMAMLSTIKPYHIRFIEYMPIGVDRRTTRKLTVPEFQIKRQLEKLGKLIPIEKRHGDGPARRYRFEGAPGEIGLISSMTHHFCRSCNRIRLTADGQLRPCLLSNIQENIKIPMRNGASDRLLSSIFLKAVKNKPFEHFLTAGKAVDVSGQMHMIGG